ncbi:mitogen-activated protein kinase kinase kinase kinase 3 isoform X2 [Nematostella vectensis]|uniref:mitogen-activated protein kinase kinase kinase kinase 3 isoform X2 n=1 Tax=Nematostella vectensis TaxID=45351 RepID=UPI0020770EA5|nr:mitogen-activated protein kinase kinase kinase kinase 3 isoform X2 [Nematostella vectensis]
MSVPLRAQISRGNPDKVFDLIEKVGGGTYGDVFKARVIATGDLAAVKVVKVEPGDDFELIQQEIAMMQQCRHNNIINYIGAYMRRDKLWIGMEYCGGGSIQDVYCVTGPCSETQISFVTVETLKGLAYLHEKSLMHRDIKGANILLTTNGEVKLADFGISARITETMKKRKSFIGTPYWMAPEMAAVERTGGYDLKCDIWAVGITAIEMAELQPPMFDLHPMRALYIIGKKSFIPPTLKEKDKWSNEMHHFIKVALIKNPKKRPSADKMLTHPFCCRHLTKAVLQDLLDRYRRKSQEKNLQPDDSDDEQLDDEHVKVMTRIVSTKARTPNNRASIPPDSILDGVQVEPIATSDTKTFKYRGESSQDNNSSTLKGDEVINEGNTGTFKANTPAPEAPQEEEPPPLPPKIKKDHYQVPKVQSSTRPTPPPKPPHLKVSRTTSADALPVRNESAHSRHMSEGNLPGIPLPKAPPPVTTCFSKIFNECPLHIYCTATWVNPSSHCKHILIGAEEGIYSLNISDHVHDMEMEQISSKKCTWLAVIQHIMVSITGTPPCVFMHNLVSLHDKSQTFFVTMARGIVYTQRITETRGCLKCCVVNNPYNSQLYLCVALPQNVLLMQWYEPLEKFMKVNMFQVDLPSPLTLFETVVMPDIDYPLICVGVRENADLPYSFDLVNLNSTSNWYTEHNEGVKLAVDTFDQLEKETILICSDNTIRFVNLEGKPKQTKRGVAEIRFDVKPDSVVCLQGSVLGFHKHGLQGRSLLTGQVSVEMNDPKRTFRLLGADSIAVVESRLTSEPDGPCNLYILASTPKNH